MLLRGNCVVFNNPYCFSSLKQLAIEYQCFWIAEDLMDDLILAIFVTLVRVMIISDSNGIDKNCYRAFLKTVVFYHYFCGIPIEFLVANTVTCHITVVMLLIYIYTLL